MFTATGGSGGSRNTVETFTIGFVQADSPARKQFLTFIFLTVDIEVTPFVTMDGTVGSVIESTDGGAFLGDGDAVYGVGLVEDTVFNTAVDTDKIETGLFGFDDGVSAGFEVGKGC